MAQSWGEDIVLALHPKFSALPLVNPPPTKKLSGQKHPNHPNSQPELAPLPQSQALRGILEAESSMIPLVPVHPLRPFHPDVRTGFLTRSGWEHALSLLSSGLYVQVLKQCFSSSGVSCMLEE